MKLGHRPILLIEDNDDDVLLMKRALADAKIANRLIVLSTGTDAIEYLSNDRPSATRASYDDPGVIFLDLKLPYCSGFEVLEWIRRQPKFKSTVVIVLSSSDIPSELRQAYELGANSYLVKLPTAEQLTDMLNSFRQYWVQYNDYAIG